MAIKAKGRERVAKVEKGRKTSSTEKSGLIVKGIRRNLRRC